MAPPQRLNDLSSNDAWVLESVFNPENALVQPPVLVNQNLSPSLPHTAPEELERLRAIELEVIRPIDTPNPDTALVEKAIAELCGLIAAHPKYASAYSNRAQALALLVGDDTLSDTAHCRMLWEDVSRAISLAHPPAADAKISRIHGRVLAAAHTQRAKLLWQAAMRAGSCSVPFEERGATRAEDLTLVQLRELDRAELEEMANRDFEIAGRYGNEDARKMATVTNPYGRLCGGIVREAMKAEMGKSLVSGGAPPIV